MENTPVVSKRVPKKKVLTVPIKEPVANQTETEPIVIQIESKPDIEPSQEQTPVEPPTQKTRTVKKASAKTAVANEPVAKQTLVAKKQKPAKKQVETGEKKGEIEIVLDERERDLYEEILKIKTDIPISKRVLTIGDILITGNEDKPLLIIERKSLQDLLASIKDGRYTEQSFRLLNASGLPPHQILYCVEGMMSSVKTQEEKTRVYSAMTSLHYYKGMSVLRTWSVQETAELMVRTAEKIRKESANGKQPYTNPVAVPIKFSEEQQVIGAVPSTEYTQTLIPSVKSANITPENIGEIMLSQIPAVSVASAKALLAVFGGDFIRFMEGLKQNDPLLQQVYFGGGDGGKRRKISGKCLENIRRLLLKTPNLNGPSTE